MSVLYEALERANARKASIWEGRKAKLGEEAMCLMLSGCDLDPDDLERYLDAITGAFLVEWAAGESSSGVVQGAICEGLLMGMMIENTAADRIRQGFLKPPEPSIVEAATSFWRLVWERLR